MREENELFRALLLLAKIYGSGLLLNWRINWLANRLSSDPWILGFAPWQNRRMLAGMRAGMGFISDVFEERSWNAFCRRIRTALWNVGFTSTKRTMAVNNSTTAANSRTAQNVRPKWSVAGCLASKSGVFPSCPDLGALIVEPSNSLN